MTAVLVVAADDARRARLQRVLADYVVLATASDAEGLRLCGYVDVDVVVRDGDRLRGLKNFVAALAQGASAPLVVAIGAVDADADVEARVGVDAEDREIRAVVDRAIERSQLVRQVKQFRTPVPADLPAATAEPGWDSDALARALKQMTRAFAAGFDLPRVLDTFLDAIGEIVRPSRAALFVEDTDQSALVVAAHRGLPLPLAGAVRLAARSGLARWLRFNGRPARLADVDQDIARELQLLHAVVAIPLLAHGELVGILALGQPVVRAGYGAREIETLFDLATHLATTVRDIALHHQIAREREFTARILEHMASGVVTIGRDHRIGTLNGRAEEILGLDARTTVGQDLRQLPSPLGDMLFETLATARTLPRTEIQLALGKRWLEVSSYPIEGDEPTPLGAVIVFDDLTAQKELAVERRHTEQLEFLTSVVARIADEIKNPLVSINTFVELLEERFDDSDFRKDFTGVVRRDTRRLVQVFEKLAGLVSEGELNFSVVDVQSVVDEFVASLSAGDEAGDRQPVVEVARDAANTRARIDVGLFKRVLAYLVGYLTHNSPGDPARIAISVGRGAEPEGHEAIRLLVMSGTARVTPETLGHLFDPVRMVQESLIHVGPAVSQRIVDAMGGRLRVRQSRAEVGFLVTVPAYA